MLLTLQHNLRIKSPGILLTLVFSSFSLGITVSNPVFADYHAPTQPVISVIEYESALTGYKALDDGERKDWKQSNDTVGEIGGWRSYAKEAYQAMQAEANAKQTSEGANEIPESAAATPDPVATAKHIEPTSVSSDNTDRAPATNKSDAQAAERSSSRPLTIVYQSAMTPYRLYDDNPPGDWKAANERVGEIGGWKTYAKEAYEAAEQEAQTEADSGNSP